MGRRWSGGSSNHHSIIYLNYYSIIVIGVIYGINRFYIKERTLHPFVHGYLHDVMAGWFMIAFLQIVLAWSKYRHSYVLHSLKLQLLVVSVAGIYWELFTPLYLPNSVSDPLDIVAYLTGALFYGFVLKFLYRNRK